MSRLRAAGPSAARTRARTAFWTLIGVNVVMLWFFLGMSASVNQHARMLDEDTLQQCAALALQGPGSSGLATNLGGARFVGDATVRFAGEVRTHEDRRGEVVEPVEFECTLSAAEDASASDRLVVQRAGVVG